MDRIQFAQEMGRLGHESLSGLCSDHRRKHIEKPLHLAVDILRKAERIASLRSSHRAVLASPTVDILEQVIMDAAIVARVITTARERLASPQRCHFKLERLE